MPLGWFKVLAFTVHRLNVPGLACNRQYHSADESYMIQFVSLSDMFWVAHRMPQAGILGGCACATIPFTSRPLLIIGPTRRGVMSP